MTGDVAPLRWTICQPELPAKRLRCIFLEDYMVLNSEVYPIYGLLGPSSCFGEFKVERALLTWMLAGL